jgi:hypothetical protein
MNNDYMTSLEEAQQLSALIGSTLETETNVVTTMEHHIDKADIAQYSVCIAYAQWPGKYMKESSYFFVKNPEMWKCFKQFILHSAVLLGYEQMEDDLMAQAKQDPAFSGLELASPD